MIKVSTRIREKDRQIGSLRERLVSGNPYAFRNGVRVRWDALLKAVDDADKVVGPSDAQHLDEAQNFAPRCTFGREFHEVKSDAESFVFRKVSLTAANSFQ